jgi:hypothetical protein
MLMVLDGLPGNLFQDMVGPLFIGLKMSIKIVGKEEQLQDSKHDKEFNQDNLPQRPAYSHGPESVPVKGVDLCYRLCHTPFLSNSLSKRRQSREN